MSVASEILGTVDMMEEQYPSINKFLAELKEAESELPEEDRTPDHELKAIAEYFGDVSVTFYDTEDDDPTVEGLLSRFTHHDDSNIDSAIMSAFVGTIDKKKAYVITDDDYTGIIIEV